MNKKLRVKAGETMGLILLHFEGDGEKASEWFRSRQKILGGLIPREMILAGRDKKLGRLIKAWLDKEYA